MKKFILGLLLGVGLAFSFSVQAEEIKSFIGAAVEGQFPVMVNGEQIDEPGLVINNTSYLPTRKIAEMFGAEVTFNADLGIEVNSRKSVTVEEMKGDDPVELTDEKQESSSGISEEEQLLIWEIERIATRIKMTKASIATTKAFIEDTPNNQGWKDLLADYEHKLSDLEAQKADLEAQLEALQSE